MKGEFRFDDGAVAAYDQLKAKAIELLRGADSYVVVAASWPDEDDLPTITIASACDKVPPLPFLQQAAAEVCHVSTTSVVEWLKINDPGEGADDG